MPSQPSARGFTLIELLVVIAIMMTVLGLYLNEIFIARLIFGSCCLSMIISILFFIREIHISTNALKLHMSDMDVDLD